MIAVRHDSAFREYCRRLIRLHQLIREDSDEGEEGESLRDEMDAFWDDMTPSEIEAAGQLIEDLYLLASPRRGEAVITPNEFKLAYSTGDWDRALAILRQYQASLPSDVANLVHGACWAQKGFPEIAIEFFRAIQRERGLTAEEQIWFVPALLSAGELEEAQQKIDGLIESGDPRLELLAAEVLSISADSFPGEGSRARREQAIAVARKALAQSPPPDELWQLMKVAGLLHVSFNLHALQRNSEAMVSCAEAIRLDPRNELGYTLMGWLTMEQQSPEVSVEIRDRLQRQLTGAFHPALSAA